MSTRPYRFEIHTGINLRLGDRFGDTLWYWRLVAPNSKTVADGGEGYSSKQAVKRAITRLVKAIESGAVEVEEGER